MAGIKQALKRVMDGRNRGVVIGRGIANPVWRGNPPEMDYIIVELEDGGHITEYDTGSDVRIDGRVSKGDDVILKILDNTCARWMRLEDADSRKGIFESFNIDCLAEGALARYDMQFYSEVMWLACSEEPSVDKFEVLTKKCDDGKDLLVPLFGVEINDEIVANFINKANREGYGSVVVSVTHYGEIGMFAAKLKVEEGKYGYTPEEYADIVRDRVGKKVLMTGGVHAGVMGTYIGPSSKYNSSHQIAFAGDNGGLITDDLHDQYFEFVEEAPVTEVCNEDDGLTVQVYDAPVAGNLYRLEYKPFREKLFVYRGASKPDDVFVDYDYCVDVLYNSRLDTDIPGFFAFAKSEGADHAVILWGLDGMVGLYAYKKRED